MTKPDLTARIPATEHQINIIHSMLLELAEIYEIEITFESNAEADGWHTVRAYVAGDDDEDVSAVQQTMAALEDRWAMRISQHFGEKPLYVSDVFAA